MNAVTQYQNATGKEGLLTRDHSISEPLIIDLISGSGVVVLETSFDIPTCSSASDFNESKYSSLTINENDAELKFWQYDNKLFGTYGDYGGKFDLPLEAQPGTDIGQLSISLNNKRPWSVGELDIEG